MEQSSRCSGCSLVRIWELTSSPWVNPGDSHPREWAFLLRWLVVSHMPACTCASAFASTGLSFPEPQGTYSVLSFIREHGSRSLAKESEHTSVSTVVFLPMTLRHGTCRNAIQFLTYDTDMLAWNRTNVNKILPERQRGLYPRA